MAKTKHTRRGTCQACGSAQAIDNVTNAVAKHGYKVAGWGFFKGVCCGAGCSSAENSLDLTNSLIAQLEEIAADHDLLVKYYSNFEVDYKAEKVNFGVFGEVYNQVTSYEEWDSTVPGTVNPRTGYQRKGGYVTKQITADTPFYIVEREQKRAAMIEEQGARHARAHVSMLRGRVVPRLGAEYYEGKEQAAARKRTEPKPRTKADLKRDLDELNRAYEKLRRQTSDMFNDIPHAERTEAQNKAYWDIPFNLCHWRQKHADAVLRLFPQAKPIVNQMNELAKIREVTKAKE